MRKALGSAALSCALGLVDAKALKWSNNGPRWVPPQETLLGYMPSLGMDLPTPTSPPEPSKVQRGLEARNTDDNTCAYISGISSSSLWCNPTARCVYNSVNSHIGCCPDSSTNCPIWTTCYDSTDRASFTTDNSRTLWCGDSSYPHCITHLYQDSDWKGYSLMGCAVAAGTGEVWATPFIGSTSTSSSSPTTRTTDTGSSSSSSSDQDSSSTSSSSSLSRSGSTTTPSPDPASSSSSTPVGPIVGGVVGGLAAIALIVLGIWALMRQHNKQKAAAAAAGTVQPQQPPPPGPAPQQQQDPHMSQLPTQQGYYGPAAGYNPHDSMSKQPAAMVAPYGNGGGGGYTTADQTTVAGSSPPGSPPPPLGYMHAQGTPSPPPPQQGQFGYGQPPQGYGTPPPQQQGGGYDQQFGNVSPGTAVSPGTTVGVGAYQQSPPLQQGQGFNGGGQHQQQQGYGGYAAELPAQWGDGELRELQG